MAIRASRLLADLQRASSTLPPYQEDLVREIVDDVTALARDVTDALRSTGGDYSEDRALFAASVVQEQSIRHSKRCLLAYHACRADRIEDVRWQRGAVLPPDVRGCVSSAEVDYFKAYSAALGAFVEDAGMDITAHGASPPKFDILTVRAVRDSGEVMTSRGVRALRRGDILVMGRADAEPLLRQGLLEVLPWEN